MIKKTNTGKWQVDITLGGRSGKRIRKVFKSRAEAKRFEADSICSGEKILVGIKLPLLIIVD